MSFSVRCPQYATAAGVVSSAASTKQMTAATDRPLDGRFAAGDWSGTLRSGPPGTTGSGSDMLRLLACRLYVGASIVSAADESGLTPYG